MHSQTAFYIGIDIVFDSLNEAHKRAVKTLEEIKYNTRNHSNIKFGFFEKDITSYRDNFWKHIVTKNDPNDRALSENNKTGGLHYSEEKRNASEEKAKESEEKEKGIIEDEPGTIEEKNKDT